MGGLFLQMLKSRMMIDVELERRVRSLALGVAKSVVIALWVQGDKE